MQLCFGNCFSNSYNQQNQGIKLSLQCNTLLQISAWHSTGLPPQTIDPPLKYHCLNWPINGRQCYTEAKLTWPLSGFPNILSQMKNNWGEFFYPLLFQYFTYSFVSLVFVTFRYLAIIILAIFHYALVTLHTIKHCNVSSQTELCGVIIFCFLSLKRCQLVKVFTVIR